MLHFKSDDDSRPLSNNEKYATFLIAFALFVLFMALIFNDFQPVKLSMLFFIVCWAVLLFIHEAGHALMGYYFGWKVEKIVFGFGRIYKSITYKGIELEFRMVPIEGFTRVRPNNFNKIRMKDALVYFAGPGIELLLAIIIFLIVGPEKVLTKTDDYIMIFNQTFIITCLTGAIINLIPQGIYTLSGEIVNDGLGILRALTSSESEYIEKYKTTDD